MNMATVSSVLDAVTVYAQGAICTRVARLALAGGALPRSVRITGLPLTLKEGSLRARVIAGPAGLAVTDVRAGFDAALPPEVDVPAEVHALEAAKEAVGQVELELAQVLRELGQIAALRPSFPVHKKGAPPREAPVGAILELAGFVDGELESLGQKRLELERRLVDARNELELRGARLAEASSSMRTARARLARAAVLTLTSPDQAAEAELALEYLVPSARWTPSYDLRLAPSMTTGALRMRASIAQRSGEDWKAVKLAVSTADLDRRTDVPELKSLRVGRSQPPAARSGWREPPPGLEELFGAYDDALGKRPARQASDLRSAGGQGQSLASAKSVGAILGAQSATASGRKGQRTAPRPSNAPKEAAMPSAPKAAPPPPPALRMPASASDALAPMAKMARRRAKLEDAESEDAPQEEGALDEVAFGGMAPGEPEPEAKPEVELGGELVDYDALALPATDQAGQRGRLAPRREPLRGLLVATQVSVQIDVLVATLTEEQHRAESVDSLPPLPHAVPLRQSAGSYDYRYDAEHRVDVEGDGAWHAVPICVADVALSPRYVCVPSMEDRVYRTINVRSRSSHALLAGGCDVTLGNEFLMTVPFPAIAPRGEDRVGLGVEEAIKVSRNTHFNETTGGLLGGSSVLTHEIQIEVANRLAHPAEIEVRERVPVPADDEIKVDEAQTDPPWKAEEGARDGVSARGARNWRVNVAAGAKAALYAKFVIKLPSGKVLVGGNRRV